MSTSEQLLLQFEVLEYKASQAKIIWEFFNDLLTFFTSD